MSAVNSLIEVGVGLNLAYGAFKGMRDGLYNYFVDSLKKDEIITQARINEDVNGGIRTSIAEITQDVREIYSGRSNFCNNIMVVIALSSACILTTFLTVSAIYPNEVIPDKMIYLCLAFVVGPILTAATLQLLLFICAKKSTDKQLLPYKHYLLVSDRITPKPPSP